MLKEDGGIKALLGMVRSGNSDVIAQVARGMANFAKCESRATDQGSSMSLYEVDILCRSSSLFTILMSFGCCRTSQRPFASNGRWCT